MPKGNQQLQPQGSDPSRRAWPLFAIAVFLGLAGLALFAVQGVRDYRVFHAYLPSQCMVAGYGVIASTMDAGLGRTRRPMTTFQSQYMLEYDLGGKHVTALGSDNLDGVMGMSGNFSVGQSYPCWYDPSDPHDAVLVRQFPAAFLFGGPDSPPVPGRRRELPRGRPAPQGRDRPRGRRRGRYAQGAPRPRAIPRLHAGVDGDRSRPLQRRARGGPGVDAPGHGAARGLVVLPR